MVKIPSGAPHIHVELLKLGIEIGETSVSKYLVCSTCSWYWRMNAVTWFISMSPHIRRRSGQPSNCERRFRLIKFRGICYAIAQRSSVPISAGKLQI